MGIVNIGTQMSEALAGLERTREVLRERPEDEDPERTLRSGRLWAKWNSTMWSSPTIPADGAAWHFVRREAWHCDGVRGAIRLGQIDHDRADRGVLQAGRRAEFTVDGVDLSNVKLPSYRTQLGVVLQETFLFDGTIRENVCFRGPDATEAEMLEACRIARVDEFAEKLEEGYDTIVGERGVKLSGGQRQRLSIARAILADPRILILDEATSSLDSESEAMIQQGLSHLMRGRTTFVIAHRLSTIRRADQILVIEGGASWSAARIRSSSRCEAAIGICIRASTRSTTICSWRPAKATWCRIPKLPRASDRTRVSPPRRSKTDAARPRGTSGRCAAACRSAW